MVDIGSIRHHYPFKSNYLNVDGHLYHYVDEGKGDPLVMLHGNPTWSFYYRKLIMHFSKKYRVIAPDHMGCGLSDKPQHYSYILKKHIQNFETLMNYLNLHSITLIVHDWGGPIGFGYAIRYPENIKRLILFNTATFIDEKLKMPFRIKICSLPILGDIFIRRLNLFSRGALQMAIYQRKKINREIKVGYLAPYNSYQNRIAQLRFVQDIPWNKKIESYSLIKDIEKHLTLFENLPILIIWGDKDFCFTKHFLKKWEHYFPKALIKHLPKAGHYVVEDGDQTIIEWIEDFL